MSGPAQRQYEEEHAREVERVLEENSDTWEQDDAKDACEEVLTDMNGGE